MELNEVDLTIQACSMREQGESYVSIGEYLISTGASTDLISRIIGNLDSMEKDKLVQKPKRNKSSTTSKLMGIILIIGGVVLAYYIWGKGWISGVSVLLVGLGFAAFGGFFDRHMTRR